VEVGAVVEAAVEVGAVPLPVPEAAIRSTAAPPRDGV
jgi:hypothetical protein